MKDNQFMRNKVIRYSEFEKNVLIILQLIVATIFFQSIVFKLFNYSSVSLIFEASRVGLVGEIFGIFIEVLIVVLMFSRFAIWGALAGVMLMSIAILFHLAYIGIVPIFYLALANFIICLIIIFIRRDEFNTE